MIKKAFKWTGMILLLLIIAVCVITAFRQNLKFDAPYPAIKASKDSAVIARGKHLVFSAAHCADCHAQVGTEKLVDDGKEVALQGGRPFPLPIGVIYSKNITPDATGIGNMSDETIARSLRYGVGSDGRAMLDFMPFHNTSDEDLTAIISYLRTLAPVQNEVLPLQKNLLGRFVTAFMIKPAGPTGTVEKTVTIDTTIAYGKYLANSVANCRGCHTNRDLMTGAFIGPDYAGGFKMESIIDPKNFSCVSPNLTPDPETGHINGWTQEIFLTRMRAGKHINHSAMPWGPFSRMNDTELKAIYKYLQTLTPVKNKTGPLLIEHKTS
jgi:mono/diheme cytochrome c family protein